MFGIVLGVCLINLAASKECTFTPDCNQLTKCKTIQDASCVCNFGNCQFEGNPFFRGNECTTYQDCGCKGTPDECFCIDGFCREEKFECREDCDCKKLEKCKDKDCACSGNTCEFDCVTEEDCLKEGSYCSETIGYKCKCENSLCKFEQLPKQCDNIKDCVDKGKCQADKECSCTSNQCVKPWFHNQQFREQYPNKNCRRPDDCEDHIYQCRGGKCTCENKVNVSEYTSWGECVLNV